MKPETIKTLPENETLNQDRVFFSAINYQQLLAVTPTDADLLAKHNQQYISRNDAHFEIRLQEILSDCQQQNVQNPRQWCRMRGLAELQQLLVSLDKPCLLALFHLGPHRDLLPDLAAAGIPFSAPIAGQVYQQFYLHKSLAPAPFGHCFELLAVDDLKIGRQLLQRIRSGRYLAIYVDGNMGPDGVNCQEGATVVQFGPVTIRVKAGVARLASQFGLSILPLFCHSEGETAFVRSGGLLPSPAKGERAQQHCMQLLYTQLFDKLCQRPEQWEYAACLQRWRELSEQTTIVSLQSTTAVTSLLVTAQSRYRLPPAQIRVYQQQQQYFLVHSGRGKAVALPDVLRPYLPELSTGFTLSPDALSQIEPLLHTGYLESCDE